MNILITHLIFLLLLRALFKNRKNFHIISYSCITYIYIKIIGNYINNNFLVVKCLLIREVKNKIFSTKLSSKFL